MIWLSKFDRHAALFLGVLALIALGVLAWQQRRIPLRIEQPTPAQAADWDAVLAEARQIDVNTATVAELERLPGIGPSLARRISDDREARGPFQRPEELQRVKGIGPKTYETLKDYVTVY